MRDPWATSILHADLDAFYASVETLRDPSLAGKPVIVGGTSSRGVVTSASYEARRFGVTSAMPTARARRLCPRGIFIQPDFEAYSEYSRRTREVFYSFSPVVETVSLDEAFIDAGGGKRMWRDPESLAAALRKEVRAQTGLVASVGAASNKFLAKLASRKAKPDGLKVIHSDEVSSFLEPLSVENLWGVGERTAGVLRRLGLRTVGDVAAVGPETLERALGSLGAQVARLASGIDDRLVVADAARKSVGAEETFERDLVDERQIRRGLIALSDRVASRLRAEGISARTVTLKVRYPNFRTITRSKTLPGEVDEAVAIFRVALGLIPKDAGRRGVRLLGVSASNLKEPRQLELEYPFGLQGQGGAFDQVRLRFGKGSLVFGAILE